MEHRGEKLSSSSTADIHGTTPAELSSDRLQSPALLPAATSSSFDNTESHPPVLSLRGETLEFTSHSNQNVTGSFRQEAGKSGILPVVNNSTSGTSAISAGASFSLGRNGSISGSSGSGSRVPSFFPFTTPPAPFPPSPSSPSPSPPRTKSIFQASSRSIVREVCPGLGSIDGQLPPRTLRSSPQALLDAVPSLEDVEGGKNDASCHAGSSSMSSALPVEPEQSRIEGGQSDRTRNDQNASIPQERNNDIFRTSSIGKNDAAPIVTANTSGAASLETIDDEIMPPNHSSFMEFQLDPDDQCFGSQGAIVSTSRSAGRNDRFSDSETEQMAGSFVRQVDDPVARKVAEMSDPKIQANRWTKFGESTSKASHSFNKNKSKMTFGKLRSNEANQIYLETNNSDAEPVPIHYLQLSAEIGVDDDHPLKTNAVHETKGRQSDFGESLPHLETCAVENLPVPLHYLEATHNDDKPNSDWVNFDNTVFPSYSEAKIKEFLGISTKENADNTFLNMVPKDIRHSEGSMIIPPDDDSKDCIFQSDDSFRLESADTSFGAADGQLATSQERTDRLGNNQDQYLSNLAVASPVDEPDLYEAVEFDPDAKTPIYHNRKYLCLGSLALLIIGAVVSLSVVFSTKEATTRAIINSPRATSSPSFSPTSWRELSGITEEIESNVLRRNATFQDMTANNPRKLALEWILYVDELQLEAFDLNLHQRYILALLAFSLDSVAWKNCGDAETADEETGLCIIATDEDEYEKESAPWLSGFDECDWYGVTCIDGYVRQLELEDNFLIGEIVPEVAGLGDHLGYLALNGNCLYGTLPPELGAMNVIEVLYLHENLLSGIFPKEFHELSNLVKLNIGYQRMNWGNCSRSDGSIVDKNSRKGDPDNGENMGFGGNILDDGIGNMLFLQQLVIEGNSFKGSISSEIGELSGLVHLHTPLNFFSGSIPTELTKLRNLTELYLEENRLTGKIPEAIGQMRSLVHFSVWMNLGMTGTIPDSLYNLTRLEHLNLAENDFSGVLSTHIGKLSELKYLSIHTNRFSGPIPIELGLCENLEFIQVNGNNFTGSIPEEVCQLREKNLFSEIFQYFQADCLPNNETASPLLLCDCCQTCCDGTSGQCMIVD